MKEYSQYYSQEEAEIVTLYLTPFFLIHFWDERGFDICNLHLYSFLFIPNHYLFLSIKNNNFLVLNVYTIGNEHTISVSNFYA